MDTLQGPSIIMLRRRIDPYADAASLVFDVNKQALELVGVLEGESLFLKRCGSPSTISPSNLTSPPAKCTFFTGSPLARSDRKPLPAEATVLGEPAFFLTHLSVPSILWISQSNRIFGQPLHIYFQLIALKFCDHTQQIFFLIIQEKTTSSINVGS